MRRITNMPLKSLSSVAVFVYALILYIAPIECVILELTGVPCLGCGMTRALMSAGKLDFAGAFRYHFMFWSVPILYISFLFDGKLFKGKRLNVGFHLLLLSGYIANWLFRINIL